MTEDEIKLWIAVYAATLSKSTIAHDHYGKSADLAVEEFRKRVPRQLTEASPYRGNSSEASDHMHKSFCQSCGKNKVTCACDFWL